MKKKMEQLLRWCAQECVDLLRFVPARAGQPRRVHQICMGVHVVLENHAGIQRLLARFNPDVLQPNVFSEALQEAISMMNQHKYRHPDIPLDRSQAIRITRSLLEARQHLPSSQYGPMATLGGLADHQQWDLVCGMLRTHSLTSAQASALLINFHYERDGALWSPGLNEAVHVLLDKHPVNVHAASDQVFAQAWNWPSALPPTNGPEMSQTVWERILLGAHPNMLWAVVRRHSTLLHTQYWAQLKNRTCTTPPELFAHLEQNGVDVRSLLPDAYASMHYPKITEDYAAYCQWLQAHQQRQALAAALSHCTNPAPTPSAPNACAEENAMTSAAQPRRRM